MALKSARKEAFFDMQGFEVNPKAMRHLAYGFYFEHFHTRPLACTLLQHLSGRNALFTL